MLLKSTGQSMGPEPKYNLHINPKHELIHKCYLLSQSSKTEHVETAAILLEQVFDNALISAGLMNDPRNIVNRLNNIMLKINSPIETQDKIKTPEKDVGSKPSDN